MSNPFRYFNSSPEVIRLVVMMYVRYPLSLRNVEDLLAERGIDISHETVRFWWNRFGPVFAAEIRKRRVANMRGYPQWRWHLDEAFVKVNGQLRYLWRAVDHEGEVLEVVVTAKRDKASALNPWRRSTVFDLAGRELRIHSQNRQRVSRNVEFGDDPHPAIPCIRHQFANVGLRIKLS
jgi:putative transposase